MGGPKHFQSLWGSNAQFRTSALRPPSVQILLKPVRFYAVAGVIRAIPGSVNHCLPSTYLQSPSLAAGGPQAAS
jgi:hypothetical protein